MTEGRELARFARERVAEHLGGPAAVRPIGEWTKKPSGTFVTLRWNDGRIQGCIGNLEPRRAIVDEVAHNAIAAATLDPRAEPLTLGDVDELDVELSILSSLEAVEARSEDEALAQLTPDVHGVVLAHRGRRSTFLPVMWSRFADGRELMRALREKAGLPADFWDEHVRLYRYTVDKHVDAAPVSVSGGAR